MKTEPHIRFAAFCERVTWTRGRPNALGITDAIEVENRFPATFRFAVLLVVVADPGEHAVVLRFLDPGDNPGMPEWSSTFRVNELGAYVANNELELRVHFAGTYTMEVEIDRMVIAELPLNVFPAVPKARRSVSARTAVSRARRGKAPGSAKKASRSSGSKK